jgi:hypothetical protein
MTAEARAEAERRYPAPTLPGDNIGLRVGFVEGAEWKGAQDAHLIQLALDAADELLMEGICYSLAEEIKSTARALSGVESSDEGEADARR